MLKKGRNPGSVDSWLELRGFYRKNVAYDETCLFRATSEQLFSIQLYHEKVRKECIDYALANLHEFIHFKESEEELLEHLQKLEKHMVICGDFELQLISRKYNRDIMLFNPLDRQLYNVTDRGCDKVLYFCLMGEDHYDVVYKKDHIQNAGMCQSIVYEMLYENVFGLSNVLDTAERMLYGKEPPIQTKGKNDINNNQLKLRTDLFSPGTESNVAPFPFKVAKALDPTIYRNIEYDSWIEVRREMRLGEWYYGDNNLILGTRCILNDEKNNEKHICYIQEIIKSENKCVVYITKSAERRTVNYADLSPENDAKPWPLPYRFSRNNSAGVLNVAPQNEKKFIKKRQKDKKRIKKDCNSSSNSQSGKSDSPTDLNSFIGAPLQMQPSPTTPTENFVAIPQQHKTDEGIEEIPEHNLLVTPDIPTPLPKFQWDAPSWESFAPVNTEVVWSHSVTPTPQFSYRPMITSAPPTPNYFEPILFNNMCDGNNGLTYWQSSPEFPAPVAVSNEVPSCTCGDNEKVENDPPMMEIPPAEEYIKQENVQNPTPTLTINSNLQASYSPQVEMFSPVTTPLPQIQIHAGNQLIYPGSIPPTPVPVFTPPIDMQYMTNPFIYPPTPPAAWYPPGINSQGFIFHSPFNHN